MHSFLAKKIENLLLFHRLVIRGNVIPIDNFNSWHCLELIEQIVPRHAIVIDESRYVHDLKEKDKFQYNYL